MIYQVGDIARVYATFTNIANVLGDPDTVTINVQSPDNTQVDMTASIVRDSTGKYHCDVPILQSGRYYYRWVGTGAIAAAQEGNLAVAATTLVPHPVFPNEAP